MSLAVAAGEVIAALEFLAEHEALLEAVKDAITGGVTEAQLLALVKTAMTSASDAEMHRELDPKS